MHVTCYMLHVTHVTCHKYQVAKNFTKHPMCYIFLESLCKMQFNGYDKNVTCHMYYMPHVTDVTCHKYKFPDNVTKYPMCYIFLESPCKIKFNGNEKKRHMSHVLHVTCHRCYMLQI